MRLNAFLFQIPFQASGFTERGWGNWPWLGYGRGHGFEIFQQIDRFGDRLLRRSWPLGVGDELPAWTRGAGLQEFSRTERSFLAGRHVCRQRSRTGRCCGGLRGLGGGV